MKSKDNSKSQKEKSRNVLKRDDVVLWKKVADTTTPLSQKRGQLLQEEMEKLMNDATPGPTAHFPPRNPMNYRAKPLLNAQPVAQNISTSNPIEKTMLRKLGKGTRRVDARIDLHGMTQDRARFALLDFLQMAQRAGHRIVLVITGRGNEGRGVLRENVPRWLSLPGFIQLVNGHEEAHGNHGGEGALYVRIRRINKGAK